MSDKPMLDYQRRTPPRAVEDGPLALPIEIWVVFGLILGALALMTIFAIIDSL